MTPKSEKEIEIGARTKLLSSAAQLFADKGFEGASIREIAVEAGVNVSLISYYFGGKEGLYRTILLEYAEAVSRDAQEFVTSFRKEEFSAKSFENFLKKLADHMVDQHIQNPNIKAMLMRETTSGMPHSKELFDDVFYHVALVISGVVAEAQERKIVRKDLSPMVFLFSMIHLVDSFVLMARNPAKCSAECFKFPSEKKSLVEEITKILIYGSLA